jgi:hypothetical protein
MVMPVEFLNRISSWSLGLFWLAYLLLGLYLSAHHLLWLIGFFIAVSFLVIIWKASPWLKSLIGLFSQEIWAVLAIALIVSLLVSLTASWSMIWVLVVLPLFTTLLAVIEIQSASFSQKTKFLLLTTLAALGLGMGEIIDLVFFPSLRY